MQKKSSFFANQEEEDELRDFDPLAELSSAVKDGQKELNTH